MSMRIPQSREHVLCDPEHVSGDPEHVPWPNKSHLPPPQKFPRLRLYKPFCPVRLASTVGPACPACRFLLSAACFPSDSFLGRRLDWKILRTVCAVSVSNALECKMLV